DDFKNILEQLSHTARRFQFGMKSQLAFLEDFYLLINDGIPANRAIEMMAQVSSGVSREVALSIAKKISQGQALAEGMRLWFSPNAVEIIRVGEEGGALVQTVKSAINTMGSKSGATSALIGAMAYPLMVIGIACSIMIYLNSTVFIQFKAIKPMDQWPDAGVRLVTLATFIQGWWWLILLIIAGLLFLFRYLMANYIGDLRPSLDKLPPFNLYRRFAAARVLETLGLLVANGVVFKNALRVMQYQANPYVGSHLAMMEHLLAMGKGNIADVLSTGLVNENDILRLRVMAEVKGFEHGLIRMGINGQEQNIKIFKLIAKIAGGILLTTGGVLIIIVVQGIYLTGMTMGQ
ncbi:MAG: type II secretion system F family protein, partial [Gammaproteobacteria bacterium]|nr:type II secretion system F family protein [Gammaproteobacteria bacterium]